MSRVNGHVRDGNESMQDMDTQNGNLAWLSFNLMNVYDKNANLTYHYIT